MVGDEQDFFARTAGEAPVQAPGDGLNLAHDVGLRIEEIEALDTEQRVAVASQHECMLAPLLRLECSPAKPPRPGSCWTLRQARGEIERRLTPSLRRVAARGLTKLCARARLSAVDPSPPCGKEAAAKERPERRPSSPRQFRDDNWWPVWRAEAPAR